MLILHIFLFPKVSFPYKECGATNRLDVLLLHELKETFCHLSEVCWRAVVVSHLMQGSYFLNSLFTNLHGT